MKFGLRQCVATAMVAGALAWATVLWNGGRGADTKGIAIAVPSAMQGERGGPATGGIGTLDGNLALLHGASLSDLAVAAAFSPQCADYFGRKWAQLVESEPSAALRTLRSGDFFIPEPGLDTLLERFPVGDNGLQKAIASLPAEQRKRCWCQYAKRALKEGSCAAFFSAFDGGLPSPELSLDEEGMRLFSQAAKADGLKAVRMLAHSHGFTSERGRWVRAMLLELAKDESGGQSALEFAKGLTKSNDGAWEGFVDGIMLELCSSPAWCSDPPKYISPKLLAEAGAGNLVSAVAERNSSAALDWATGLESSVDRGSALSALAQRFAANDNKLFWVAVGRMETYRNQEQAVSQWARHQAADHAAKALDRLPEIEDAEMRYLAATKLLNALNEAGQMPTPERLKNLEAGDARLIGLSSILPNRQ